MTNFNITAFDSNGVHNRHVFIHSVNNWFLSKFLPVFNVTLETCSQNQVPCPFLELQELNLDGANCTDTPDVKYAGYHITDGRVYFRYIILTTNSTYKVFSCCPPVIFPILFHTSNGNEYLRMYGVNKGTKQNYL